MRCLPEAKRENQREKEIAKGRILTILAMWTEMKVRDNYAMLCYHVRVMFACNVLGCDMTCDIAKCDEMG